MAKLYFRIGADFDKVIKDIFVSPSRFTFDAYTKDSPDELKPGGRRL